MSASGGIVAVGAAVPRLRLARATIAASMRWVNPALASLAKGSRATCNWDEDAITLAVEAARGALASTSESASTSALTPAPVPPRAPTPTPIDALYLASTTLPFADRDGATMVAAALDLPRETETLTLASSMRAGIGALRIALRRTEGRTLVVAADARRAKPGSAQEMAIGHGAAAIIVDATSDAPRAALVGSASVTANFVDHYRAGSEDFEYSLEERWVREEGYAKLVPECVERACAQSSVDVRKITQLVMPGPPTVIRKIVERLGLGAATIQDGLHADCGDIGTGHALLMLVAALEGARPGDVLAVVGFGQGVEVLIMEVRAARNAQSRRPVAEAIARRIDEPSYTRFLSHQGVLVAEFGMRAERDNRTAHATAWRKARQVDAFVGGRCTACGTVQFPRFRVCVNPECRATDTLEDHALAAGRGRVKSFTEDWQAYSPRPPYIYGNVEFAEGGNLLMEFTDLEAGDLAVGDEVRFVYRVKDIDAARGFRRYFWKAVRT